MAIKLEKGQRISLTKEAPKLQRLMCGLGWDVVEAKGGFLKGLFQANASFDLDASVLCLDQQQKLKDKSDIVYFGNLRHVSNAVTHLGDNLTGEGDGDDEQIIVDLVNLPSKITKLVFVVNIYDALKRQQEFSQVANAFVRLVNLANNQEIARYTLSGSQYQGQTAMIMAEIYRQDQDWQVMAIGKGLKAQSLGDIVQNYV
jgi:stress response protein SCP2